MAMWTGHSPCFNGADNTLHVQEKLLPTCKASLKLWPIAHAVNFALIPSQQRLLYINVISVRLFSPACMAAPAAYPL